MSANALVLGGGGSRGAYQIGAIIALHELGYDYKIVTGTSVGALNALLIGQDKFELLKEIWINLDFNTIVKHEYKWKNRVNETFVKGLLKGGLSLEPLEKLVKKHVVPSDLKKTTIKTGLVYTRPFRKYTPIKIEEVSDDKIHDLLITSCSAFPFLKKKVIDGKKCYDGYFSDNLPVKLAKEMGATKVIAIDIMRGFRKKVGVSDIDYLYIKPTKKLGFFLDFTNEVINDLIKLGYEDIMNHKEKILEFINK